MLAEASIFIKIGFLFIAGFLSAFIDSIAGGGGMISMPAYLIVGFPTHYTLGTNKFSATSGTFTSAYRFHKSGNTDRDILKVILPFSFLGAVVGVKAVLALDPEILKPLVLFLLLGVGINTIFSRELGLEDSYEGTTRKNLVLGAILGFSTGFYDGFFGPGAGSLIMFGLVKIYGFDFLRAAGNAKVMNLTSNLVSVVLFAISGKIYFLMGIPMAISMILGARAGSKLAIEGGSKLVKPIFIIISLAVAIKMIYELLN